MAGIDSSTLDISAINAVLKQRYTKKQLNTISFADRPGLAAIAKDTNGGGANLVVGIRNSLPQTRSATFANAQAASTYAAGPSTYNSWTITWFSDYGTANITGQVIDQAKGDENALVDAVVSEVDGMIENLANSAAVVLYHNGGGARGSISANATYPTSGNTIQLATPDDVTNFALNMCVQLSSDDGTGGAGVTTGGGGNNVGFIVGIDYDQGLLTLSASLNGANANWTTVFNGAASGYFIFAQGDYNKFPAGYSGWLPSTAPGSGDSFYGVNRSKDPTKLAGVRVAGNGAAYEETAITAMTRVGRMGGKPKVCMVNPTDWSAIEKSQQGRVVYNRVDSFDDPEIGFKSLVITGPKGPVDFVSDVYCPTGNGYLLQPDTWLFYSMGEIPRIIEEDGLRMLRSATSDAYEVRGVWRGAPACTAPGWNGHISW